MAKKATKKTAKKAAKKKASVKTKKTVTVKAKKTKVSKVAKKPVKKLTKAKVVKAKKTSTPKKKIVKKVAAPKKTIKTKKVTASKKAAKQKKVSTVKKVAKVKKTAQPKNIVEIKKTIEPQKVAEIKNATEPKKIIELTKEIVTPKKVPTDNVVNAVIKGIQELKGNNIVCLDLREIETSVCDYFIICDANSRTQVDAIAQSIKEEVKKQTNVRPFHSEGYQNSEWILIDYITTVVHIFQPEIRSFYNLEGLWADAEKMEVIEA